MESHVAACSIQLLKSLEYGSSKVAPYILGRNSISFHPSGASVYGGASGSKVCRCEVSASTGAMLDLKSLCIIDSVYNLETTAPIQFLSPSLSGLLQSARVVIAGVEASSCDHIAWTEHVLSLLQADDARRSDFNAGFDMEKEVATDVHGAFVTKEIPAQASRNAT